MRKALTSFVGSLPERVKGKLGSTEVDVVMHSYAVKRLLAAGASRADPEATTFGKEVELARRRLRGAVVSKIDKERGVLVVM